jgi:dihydropteroate synthase
MDFKKTPEVKEDAEIVHGRYHPIKDWVMDEKGYLLIRVNRKEKRIEAGLCKAGNLIEKAFYGATPQDIYFEIASKNLLSRPEHYAYLGKELEKAYLALKYDLQYVQDDELDLKR